MTQDEAWLLKEKYAGEKTEGFFADCDRLAKGEPVAYLIGNIPFLNTTIFLDNHPLIPRTETEFWVAQIISQINQHIPTTNPNPRATLGLTLGWPSGEARLRILDLCAGSGCIGVAVLKNISDVLVDFVEIDATLHATIKKNIRQNETAISHTRIFGGDLFENITETYDYILTNPPYIDPVQNHTEESVKKYEPAHALYADEDGLALIFRIIDAAPRLLKPHGTLVIEHDPEQSEKIKDYAIQQNFDIETCPDQFGVERYSVLKLSRST